MYFTSLFRKNRSSRPSARKRRGHRPWLEVLEARCVPALVPLTITIPEFVQIDDPDFGINDDGDYYTEITIGSNPEHVSGIVNGSDIHPNWTFTDSVENTAGPVAVHIDIFDDDGGLNFGRDTMDINPQGGKTGLDLLVDPLTGIYSGDLALPATNAQGNGDTDRGRVTVNVAVGNTAADSDGDGLPDSWEINGVDANNNGNRLNLKALGADPNHKDLFVELDWMAGAVPTRDAIQALKTAFAVAPVDAGTNAVALTGGQNANSNPDGKPGINLWVDTGNLQDAAGNFVGDNFGGGNQVPTFNVSNLTANFYTIKNGLTVSGIPVLPANFNANRRLVFRYAVSAASPTNTAGTSTGGNSSTTLNDITQSWVTNEWSAFQALNVTITGGTGAGQTNPITSNTSNQLTLKNPWSTVPDATSTYSISWSSGGWSEVGGNDIIEYNHDAGTIMHELGHSLNLQHGGFENNNYKPNYVSVMNYDHQFGIPQNNSGASIIDYSPARISAGSTTTGANTPTTLNDTTQKWTVNQWQGGFVEINQGQSASTGGNGPTTLNDTTQAWVTNQWAGAQVQIIGGTGTGQTLAVASNTATQLTVSSPWATTPDATSVYALLVNGNVVREVRPILSNTATQLVLATGPVPGQPSVGPGEPWSITPAFGTPYALYTATQTRGLAPLPSLVELAPNETLVLDPTDNANRLIFSNPAGTKTQFPLNGLDRNGDKVPDGPDYDNNGAVNNPAAPVNLDAPNDTTIGGPFSNPFAPLQGSDDWHEISLPFRQFGDSASSAINPDDDPHPTLAQLRASFDALRTADLGLAVTTSAGTVNQGDHLVYNFTASVSGSNPADGVSVTDTLPPGVTFVSATSSQGSSSFDGTRVHWNLGSVWPFTPVTFRLEVVPLLVGSMTNTATASTAGIDPAPANNSASATTTVLNVPPKITSLSLAAASIRENDTATLTVDFTDPGLLDTHTATVSWGEGSPVTVNIPLGARTFTVSHQYLDDNPTGTPFDQYPIEVTVADNNNGSDSKSTQITVNNVAPQLQNVAVTGTIDENGVVTLSGDVADPGTLDTFRLLVDWGEGAPQPFDYGAGTTHFSETHQYLDDNPTGTPQDQYTIHLTLTDDDTGQATATAVTLVRNVNPVLTGFVSSSPSSNLAREGDVVTVTGTFTDVGTLDTHTATVDWDDGTVTMATVTESGGSGGLVSNHIFTSGGIYTVTVTLTDDDTGTATASKAVFITGVGVHRLPDGRTALEVVGTNTADDVTINQLGDGQIKVHASFLPEKDRTLPSAGIQVLEVVLLGGNDRVTVAGNVSLPAVIDGGDGDDQLNGGNGPTVLIGGRGNDSLLGGNARSILIGGLGVDRLNGNAGDDILIGGTTSYDSGVDDDKLANDLALLKLLDEWNSPRSYADRVANLRTGSGPILAGTGKKLAKGMTVFDDLDADQFVGAGGMDWFFFDARDFVNDRKSDEAAN